MGKSGKDYWKEIRIPMPPPGKAMPSDKDYNRKKIKKINIEEES